MLVGFNFFAMVLILLSVIMMAVTAVDQEFNLLNESMKNQTVQSAVLMEETVTQLSEVNHGICMAYQLSMAYHCLIITYFTSSN